jgi:hypothetical protein
MLGTKIIITVAVIFAALYALYYANNSEVEKDNF